MAGRRASPSQIAVRTLAALAALLVLWLGGNLLWRLFDDDWCNRFREPSPIIDAHGGIDCDTIVY